MPDIILTLKQIEDIFQALTSSITGLGGEKDVRLSWPTYGAPGWKIDEDVVFVKALTVPDEYSQQREEVYYRDSIESVESIHVESLYTRVHLVQWTFYGPNSYDLAETLKNGFYSQGTKEALMENNLFFILDAQQPTRVPELYNGQWWERVDFEAKFNELVTRNSSVPYLSGLNIQVVTDK